MRVVVLAHRRVRDGRQVLHGLLVEVLHEQGPALIFQVQPVAGLALGARLQRLQVEDLLLRDALDQLLVLVGIGEIVLPDGRGRQGQHGIHVVARDRLAGHDRQGGIQGVVRRWPPRVRATRAGGLAAGGMSAAPERGGEEQGGERQGVRAIADHGRETFPLIYERPRL